MKYNVEIEIHQSSKQGTIQILESKIILSTQQDEKTIEMKSILGIGRVRLDKLNIFLNNNEKISLKGENIIEIENHFNTLKPYQDGNVKLNNKEIHKRVVLKHPCGIALIYTLLTILIYSALIGWYASGKQDEGMLQGLITLGNVEGYPTDSLQITFFIILILLIISNIYLEISYKNKCKKDLLEEK